MKEKSLVAIVLLNYNGKKWLSRFLPKLTSHSDPHSIVLADNASTDDSVEYVRGFYPNIQIIQNKTNAGFAQGYNEALAHLEGKFDYYLLINTDIEVTENWVEPLLTVLEKDPTYAGVQPKIRSFYQRDSFEHAGASGGFVDRSFYPFCRGRLMHITEKDEGQYNNQKEIFWATGACMLVRSSVFHELEGFDCDFFAHMEEIDFCWRAKKRGYRFCVEPKSMVYHVGGGTLSYVNPQKTYLNFRNNLFMIHKNYDGILFLMIFKRLVLDGVAGVKFLVGMSPKNTLAVIKAHFSYYAALSELNKKRKTIQRSTVNKGKLTGMFTGCIIWAFYFKRIRKFSKLNVRLFVK